MCEAELPRRPEEFLERFVPAFNSGDLNSLVELYCPDALLNFGAGQVFRGREAIRSVLANLLALRLPMRVLHRFLTCGGDTALLSFDWVIEGKAPDGRAVKMAGTACQIIHHDSDGYWRQLLDNPFGTATKPPYERISCELALRSISASPRTTFRQTLILRGWIEPRFRRRRGCLLPSAVFSRGLRISKKYGVIATPSNHRPRQCEGHRRTKWTKLAAFRWSRY